MDRAPGSNRSQIARTLGISRNTVGKPSSIPQRLRKAACPTSPPTKSPSPLRNSRRCSIRPRGTSQANPHNWSTGTLYAVRYSRSCSGLVYVTADDEFDPDRHCTILLSRSSRHSVSSLLRLPRQAWRYIRSGPAATLLSDHQLNLYGNQRIAGRELRSCQRFRRRA